MKIDFKEIEKQGLKAVETLEKLTSVKVPKSLKDALHEDWIALFHDGGIDMMSAVPVEELRKWNQRVITMRDANIALQLVEERLVWEFVRRPDSPWTIAAKRMLMVPRFILEHLGEIVSFALPMAAEGVVNKVVSDIGRLSSEVVEEQIEIESRKENADVNKVARLWRLLDAIDRERETVDNRVAIMVSAISALVVYWSIEGVLGFVRSTAAYRSKVVATVASNHATQGCAKEWALPQRPRKAFRVRRKAR